MNNTSIELDLDIQKVVDVFQNNNKVDYEQKYNNSKIYYEFKCIRVGEDLFVGQFIVSTSTKVNIKRFFLPDDNWLVLLPVYNKLKSTSQDLSIGQYCFIPNFEMNIKLKLKEETKFTFVLINKTHISKNHLNFYFKEFSLNTHQIDFYYKKKPDTTPIPKGLVSYFKFANELIESFKLSKIENLINENFINDYRISLTLKISFETFLANKYQLNIAEFENYIQKIYNMSLSDIKEDLAIKEFAQILKSDSEFIKLEFYSDINIHKPNLSKISLIYGVSASIFDLAFVEAFGLKPMQYFRKLRVEYLKEQLRQSHKKIADISKFMGYEQSGKLNQFFKRHTGVTLAEYRNIHLNNFSG